jgi:hypothetical protein
MVRTSRKRTSAEPGERAQRISQVVDLYLQVTASGVASFAAALLRAGAALLHDENEIREAAHAISKYTGHNPLSFMKEFPNVTAKDFFRTALAESRALLDPAEIRDLGVRLMRGLLQSRLAEAARDMEQVFSGAIPELDGQELLTINAMKPLLAMLEQLRLSVGAPEDAAISWPPDGRSARVKAGAGGATTELYFSFDAAQRKYRVDSRTRYTYAPVGLHEQVFFTLTPQEAADYATRMIGRYMGVRAAYAKHTEARAELQ